MGTNCDKYGQAGTAATYKPPNEWDPQYLAILNQNAPAWFGNVRPIFRLPAPPPAAAAAGEVEYLRNLKETLRATLLPAINDENNAFEWVFEEVLGIEHVPAARKVRARELLNRVDIAAKFWTMKQKDVFNRPRPVQLAADLDPPFCPGHPAYPSGHAAESFTEALALIDALDQYPQLQPRIIAATRRIGFHREVAGVHYPSDTMAGTMLATQLIAALRGDQAYLNMVDLARRELAGLLGPQPARSGGAKAAEAPKPVKKRESKKTKKKKKAKRSRTAKK